MEGILAAVVLLTQGLAGAAAAAEFGLGQVPAADRRRPDVVIKFSNEGGAISGKSALGILDTGDFLMSLLPETNAELGNLPPGPPEGKTVYVTNPVTLTGAGILGLPVTPTTPAIDNANKTFDDFTAAQLNQANPARRTGLRVSVIDFVNTIGTPFLSNDRAAWVDPINGGRLSAPAPKNQPADNPEATYTSISFFDGTSERIPVDPRNVNPGAKNPARTFFLDLKAIKSDGTEARTFAGFNARDGAYEAPRPFITVSLFGSGNSKLEGQNAMVDTGNPFAISIGPGRIGRGNDKIQLTDDGRLGRLELQTTAGKIVIENVQVNPARAGQPDFVVGAGLLNQFGQFFDLPRKRLVLQGPLQPDVLFSVTQGTEAGLERTAVRLETTIGSVPRPAGNVGSDIFRTNVTGSNATLIRDQALGLAPAQFRDKDELKDFSLGKDVIRPKADLLFFAVDARSSGQAGTDVRRQFDNRQQQGDIFVGTMGTPLRTARGANDLWANQELLGLRPNVGPQATAGGGMGADGLDGLELDLSGDFLNGGIVDATRNEFFKDTGDRKIEGVEGRFGANGGFLPLRRGIGEPTPLAFPGLPTATAEPHVFFSAENPDRLIDPADIFVDTIDTVFAGRASLGLVARDRLDALALFDFGMDARLQAGTVRNPRNQAARLRGGRFDPNQDLRFGLIDSFYRSRNTTDLALFSLAPGSPTLAAFDLSPGDLFVSDFDGSFSLHASFQSLGLLGESNITALDVRSSGAALPDPPALALLGTGALGLLACALVQRKRAQVGSQS